MKKAFKVVLIIVAVFIAVFFIGGSIGKKEVKNLTIESVHLDEISDGEYIGSYSHSRWQNTVQVIVSDNNIVRIIRIEPSDTTNQSIVDELINRIIDAQDIRVDTISGATVNSNAFLKAVENALTGE